MGSGCRTAALAAGKFFAVFFEPVLVTDMGRVLGKSGHLPVSPPVLLNGQKVGRR